MAIKNKQIIMFSKDLFMANVHVQFRGQQQDISFEELFSGDRYEALGINTDTVASPQSVSDTQIRMALAQKFDVGVGEFQDLFIEKNPNGNITVRPNAVFG